MDPRAREIKKRLQRLNEAFSRNLIHSGYSSAPKPSHGDTGCIPEQIFRTQAYPVTEILDDRFKDSERFRQIVDEGLLIDYFNEPIFRVPIDLDANNRFWVVSDPENDLMLQAMRGGTSNFIKRVEQDPMIQRSPTPQEIMFYIHGVCFGESRILRHPLTSIRPESSYYLGELVTSTHFVDLPCSLRAMAVHSVAKPFIPTVSLSSGRYGILSERFASPEDFPAHVWTTFEDNEGNLRIGDPRQFSPDMLQGHLPDQVNASIYGDLVRRGNQIFPRLQYDSHPPTQDQYLDSIKGDDGRLSLMRTRNQIVYWDGRFNYRYSAPLSWHMWQSE